MIAALSLQQPNRATPPPVHLVAVSQHPDTCFFNSPPSSEQNARGESCGWEYLTFVFYFERKSRSHWLCAEVIVCLNLMFEKSIYHLFQGVLVVFLSLEPTAGQVTWGPNNLDTFKGFLDELFIQKPVNIYANVCLR